MHVVALDRKYPDVEDPWGEVVREAGATIEYAAPDTEAALLEAIEGADVVMTLSHRITPAVIDRLSDARVLIQLTAGVDRVDLGAATAAGLPVSHIPGGYVAPELAAHAIGLMIAAAHEVVRCDRALRAGPGWGRREDINPMNGGTFGIVGFGRIGRATVAPARGLDMTVIATDPYVADDVFSERDVERVDLPALLERADCVSIHAPLTAETRGRFGAEEFAAMDERAVLVNTARGPIVDSRALVEAIEAGELWGAAVDVFEEEPPDDSPLLECDRVVCSPHHGGRSPRSRRRALSMVREELGRALSGEPLRNVVNPGALQYESA